jgi:hypothetical protein
VFDADRGQRVVEPVIAPTDVASGRSVATALGLHTDEAESTMSYAIAHIDP